MRSAPTGFTGIAYNEESRKYVAQATRAGKNHYIGQYDTLEAAQAGREEALRHLPAAREQTRVQCDSHQARMVAQKIQRLTGAGWSITALAAEVGVGRYRLVWVAESVPGQELMEYTLTKLDHELDRVIDSEETADENLPRTVAALDAYIAGRRRRGIHPEGTWHDREDRAA